MRLLIILLLTAFSFIAKAQGPQAFWWALMQQGYTPPLAGIVGTLSAWGTVKLNSSYTGYCVKVRRSTDNSLQDIGFDTNGYLDATAFSTFVGGGTGYVQDWYDQSGGGYNLSQNTLAAQPQLQLNVQGGRAALWFDGNDTLSGNSTTRYRNLHETQGTVTVVAKAGTTSNPNTAYVILGNNGGASTQAGYFLSWEDRSSFSWNDAFRAIITNGTSGQFVVSDLVNNSWTPNSWKLVNHLVDNTQAASGRSVIYINNSSVASANASSATPFVGPASRVMSMGSQLVGYISTAIIHDAKLSTTNVQTLNSRLNSIFSIY